MSRYKFSIWGDSILKGVVLDNEKMKYKYLDTSAVNIFKSKYPVTIENHSRFGCTVSRAYPQIIEAVEKEKAGDFVLIEFGGNDCDYNWIDVSASPSGSHEPNTPYNQFELLLAKIAQKIVAFGKKPIFMTLPPIDADRYFDYICRSDKVCPKNILAFLKEKKTIYRQQERYSNAVAKIAYQLSVPLVDVRDAFLSQKNLSDYLCIDGIHPNKTGQLIIADEFSRRYVSAYGQSV